MIEAEHAETLGTVDAGTVESMSVPRHQPSSFKSLIVDGRKFGYGLKSWPVVDCAASIEDESHIVITVPNRDPIRIEFKPKQLDKARQFADQVNTIAAERRDAEPSATDDGAEQKQTEQEHVVVSQSNPADVSGQTQITKDATGTEEKTPSKFKLWHKVVLGIVGAFIALAIIGSFIDNDDASTSKSDDAATSSQKHEKSSKKEEKPKAKKLTPEQKLGRNIKKNVSSDAKIDTKTDIRVTLPYPENLTKGLTRKSAKMDATEIVEIASKSKALGNKAVIIHQTATLVDKLGNESEEKVVMLTFFNDRVKGIKFENFDTDNIWDVANEKFIHPAIR